MNFKLWLQDNHSIIGYLNEVRVDPNINKKQYSFYVDDGVLKSGTGTTDSFYNPYVNIDRSAKSIITNNLEPTTKQFKDIINALKKFIPDIYSWTVDVMGLSHSRTGKLGHIKYSSGGSYYGNQDRPVSYYMRHEDTNVNPGRMPKYLYHGTSTELWYEGIKKQGLLPRLKSALGAAGSYGSGGDALSKGKDVYLAVHPDAATRMAAEQAANQHGGKPLILRISTSGLELGKFGHDDDADRHYLSLQKAGIARSPQAASSLMMGTVSYDGKIAPSLIEPLVIGERQIVGNTISFKWTRFKETEREEHPLTKLVNDKFERKGEVSQYDSPYYWALIDAGIMEHKKRNEESYHRDWVVTRKVTDKEIRDLIKKSPWVRDAEIIRRWVGGNYVENQFSKLYDIPVKVEDPSHQKIIDMLIDSKLIESDHGRLGRTRSWEPTMYILDFVKKLHAAKMTADSLLKKMNEINEKYPWKDHRRVIPGEDD